MAMTRGRWAAVVIALLLLAAAAAAAFVFLTPDPDAEVRSVTWSVEEVDLSDAQSESVTVGVAALSEDNAVTALRLESEQGETAELTDVQRARTRENGVTDWRAALNLPEETTPGRWYVVSLDLEKRALRGLEVPERLDAGVTLFVGTALSIEGPGTVPVGSSAEITGTLTRTDGTTPLPDAVVILEQFEAGSWVPAGEESTDANGTASFEVTVDASGGTYRLRHVGGEAVRGSLSSELTVATRKVTRTLTLDYNDDATEGLGQLAPAQAGVDVQVQQAPPLSTEFQTVGTVRTDDDGRFSFALEAFGEYRAYVPEDAGHTAATSNVLSVGD